MVLRLDARSLCYLEEGTPGRAGRFPPLNLAREDSWNDVCSGISSEVTLQVEFFKPLITDRSAQSCPQSWCLFFFFFCRLTDLFLVLIYSTLVSEVFCFKQTDDQKTVTCTFKELVFLRIA